MTQHSYNRTLVRHIPDLLQKVVLEANPADKVVNRFFVDHKKLGKNDRKVVSHLVFGVLRKYRTLQLCLQALAGSGSDKSKWFNLLTTFYLLLNDSYDQSFFNREELGFDLLSIREVCNKLEAGTTLHTTNTELPDWVLDNLPGDLSGNERQALSQALDIEAPLDIRVNPLKTDIDSLRDMFAGYNLTFKPTPYSPFGLRSETKTNISDLAEFSSGFFEVQDEGSQISCLLAKPKMNDVTIDLCAGSGGKTLFLGALQRNRGTVYAFDNARHRLEKLIPRLKRSGLENISYAPIDSLDDEKIRRMMAKADGVVIDAPCSGSGTLRRHPEIKWHEPDLVGLASVQGDLLKTGGELVKPGGKLIYITCSLLEIENESVVDRFLMENRDFSRQCTSIVLQQLSMDIPDAVNRFGDMRLYPHRHGTDGFFVSILKKM